MKKNRNREEEIYSELYSKMCTNCQYAKKCHEECEECDDFLGAYEELLEEEDE